MGRHSLHLHWDDLPIIIRQNIFLFIFWDGRLQWWGNILAPEIELDINFPSAITAQCGHALSRVSTVEQLDNSLAPNCQPATVTDTVALYRRLSLDINIDVSPFPPIKQTDRMLTSFIRSLQENSLYFLMIFYLDDISECCRKIQFSYEIATIFFRFNIH